MRSERIFYVAVWLPAALWIAIEIYISQFEGWGAWAAAPLLLGPLFLSLVLGMVALFRFVRLPKGKKASPASIMVLLVPWAPILYVVAAYYWRQLTMPVY